KKLKLPIKATALAYTLKKKGYFQYKVLYKLFFTSANKKVRLAWAFKYLN
ncbi:hypothetical protein BO86DRAFT_308124, partial [Aspergillus japonicus CBS 114.51]